MSRVVIEKYITPTTISPSISNNVTSIQQPVLSGIILSRLSTAEIVGNGVAQVLTIEAAANKAELQQSHHVHNQIKKLLSQINNADAKQLLQNLPTSALYAEPPLDENGNPMHLLAQLNSRVLGSTSYRQTCDVCMRNSNLCRGHGTHLKVYWPIQNVAFASTVCKYMHYLCYFCADFKSRAFKESLKRRFNPTHPDNLSSLAEQAEWCRQQREWFRMSIMSANYPTCPPVCEHCGLPQPAAFRLSKPDHISVEWDNDFIVAWRKNHLGNHVLTEWTRETLEVLNVHGVAQAVTIPDALLDATSLLNIQQYASNTKPSAVKKSRRWLELSTVLLHPLLWADYLKNHVFTAADVKSWHDMVDADTVWLFADNPHVGHIKDMTMTHLPIVTRAIRPQSVDVESSLNQTVGGMKKTQDVLTRYYCTIAQLSAMVRKVLIHSKELCVNHLKAYLGSGLNNEETQWKIHACAIWLSTPLSDLWRLSANTRVGVWASNQFLFDTSIKLKHGFLQCVVNTQHEVNLMIDKSATLKRGKAGLNNEDSGDNDPTATASPSETTGVGAIMPSRRHNTGRTGARIASGAVASTTVVHNNKVVRITPEAKVKQAMDYWQRVMQTSTDTIVIHEEDDEPDDNDSLLACLCCIKACGRHTDYWQQDPAHIDQGLLQWLSALKRYFKSATTTPLPNKIKSRLNHIESVIPDTHTYSNQKIPPGVLERQGTKKGRILNSLMVKRCDWSARLVFSANNTVRVGALKLPTWVVASQTKIMVVNQYNRAALLACVKRGANRIGGAAAVITDKHHIIWLKPQPNNHILPSQQLSNNEPLAVVLKIGWRVLVYLQKGNYVLLDRQPTLQKASCNAHAIDFIAPLDASFSTSSSKWDYIDSDTAQFSEDATEPYNFDFDGDVGALTFPTQLSSRVEVTFMMNIPNTYICPRRHMPIFKLKQSTLLGCWLLSQDTCWLNQSEAQYLVQHMRGLLPRHLQHVAKRPTNASQAGTISQFEDCYANHYTRTNIWPISQLPPPDRIDSITQQPQWSGRQILALTLPHDFCFAKGGVVIKNGRWIKGNGATSTFNGHKTILHHLWLYYSKQYAVDVQSEWGLLASLYLEKVRGFTCGLDDLDVGVQRGEATQSRHLLARRARDNFLTVIQNAYVRLAQSLADVVATNDNLSDAQIRTLYDYIQTKSDAAMITMGNIHVAVSDLHRNHVMLMSNKCAGSKGSVANTVTISDIVGFRKSRGLSVGAHLNHQKRRSTMHAVGERTPETAGLISSPFLQGLTAQELFSSNQIDRPGIYDSSDLDLPGYQQKRFSKHAGSETVGYDGTIRNGAHAIIQLCYGGDGYDPVYSTHIKLSGRLLSCGFLPHIVSLQLQQLVARLTKALLDGIVLRPYHKMKTRRDFYRDGFACLLPLDVQDVFAQYAQTDDTAMHPLDETVLCEFVSEWIPSHTLPTCEPLEFQLHVLDVCLTNWYGKSPQTWPRKQLITILAACGSLYHQRMFEPGSAAGGNMAQNVSEPAAQIKLRTFNPVATTDGGVKFVGDGLKQFEELIATSNAKSEANNTTTVYLDPRWVSSLAAAKMVEQALVSCTLGQLVHLGHIHSVDLSAADTLLATVSLEHMLWPALYAGILTSYPVGLSVYLSFLKEYPIMTFEIKETACLDKFGSLTQTEAVLARGLLPFQRAMVVGGPMVARDCPYYWVCWNVYSHEDLQQWMREGRSSAVWRQHVVTMRELAKHLYASWRVSGEAAIGQCAGGSDIVVPTLLDDESCDDSIPTNVTTAALSSAHTTQIRVNQMLAPNAPVSHDDLLWTRRVWPNLLKQLQHREQTVHHTTANVTYCHDLTTQLTSASKHSFEHVLGAQVYLAALIQRADQSVEVIVLLKSPQTLVREGWLRSLSEMANVGVDLPRQIMTYFGQITHLNITRVQIVSEHAYTEQLVKFYLASLEYLYQDDIYKGLYPLGVKYANPKIKMELWRAKDFYYDWWSHRLLDQMEVVLPFADEAAQRAFYAQQFGSAVADIQDLQHFTSALHVYYNNDVMSRRFGVLPNGTLIMIKRANCPKVNMRSVRVISLRPKC